MMRELLPLRSGSHDRVQTTLRLHVHNYDRPFLFLGGGGGGGRLWELKCLVIEKRRGGSGISGGGAMAVLYSTQPRTLYVLH